MEKYLEELLLELKKPSTLEETKNKKLLGEIEQFGLMMEYLEEHNLEKAKVLDNLLKVLDQLDVYKACCISHFCGYLIETAGMSEFGSYLIDFYAKVIKLSLNYLEQAARQLGIKEEDFNSEMESRLDIEALFSQNADEVRAYQGCDMATLAVMSAITINYQCRLRLRESSLYNAMDTLQNFIPNVFYPLQVQEACWEVPLIVLAPEVKRGFKIQVNDLINNFQLLAFLEAELSKKHWIIRYGMYHYPFQQDIYDYLTGAVYPKEYSSAQLHMNYTSWDGTMIWGEMSPETIPQIEETKVIIMKKEGMVPRSFDVRFILKWHPALNPYCNIQEELTPEEVDSWINKISESSK